MNHCALTHLCFWLLLALAGQATSFAQTPRAPSLAFGAFEPTVPVVLIEAKSTVSDQKVPCTLRIVCPKGSQKGNTNQLQSAVRLHGASSRGFPKKSFAFSLDRPAQLLGLRSHDDWVLNAAYVDRSLMRHKLSYDLFRSLSAGADKRFAAASRFVEVYLNGSYQGVYLLMERVDKALLQLNRFNTNDASHACIYKAEDHAANFGSPGHGGYEQREPKFETKPYWRPLDEFNKFVSTTSEQQLWHGQTGIATRLNLQNAIDFHLLVLLSSNSDGITKNFFLARNNQASTNTPVPRFFFAPWDYDGSFGQNWDGSPYPHSEWLSNNLFERLMRNKGYRDKFVARWQQLRDHQFSVKTIHGLIDQNVRVLEGAVRRNFQKWPPGGGFTFEKEIAGMKEWTEARFRWLDQEITRNIPARSK